MGECPKTNTPDIMPDKASWKGFRASIGKKKKTCSLF
jgi:hypothetical protein